METIYFNGQPCRINGNIARVGETAPCFSLVTPELKEITCKDFKGKRVVLNVFPSLDTEVCAMSVRKFNEAAAGLENTVVLCVSKDLPFAAARFCSANGISNVIPASTFRAHSFDDYGLEIADGPLAGLLARAVIEIDENGKVIYSELVEEITKEPDYAAALEALKK